MAGKGEACPTCRTTPTRARVFMSTPRRPDTAAGTKSAARARGAPQWAGIFALVNQGRASLGKSALGTGQAFGVNSALYKLAGGSSYTNASGDFFDVTSGSSGIAQRPATTSSPAWAAPSPTS